MRAQIHVGHRVQTGGGVRGVDPEDGREEAADVVLDRRARQVPIALAQGVANRPSGRGVHEP